MRTLDNAFGPTFGNLHILSFSFTDDRLRATTYSLPKDDAPRLAPIGCRWLLMPCTGVSHGWVRCQAREMATSMNLAPLLEADHE